MPTRGVRWLRKCIAPFELQVEVSRLGRLREGKEDINRIFTWSPEVRKSESHRRGSQRLQSVVR